MSVDAQSPPQPPDPSTPDHPEPRRSGRTRLVAPLATVAAVAVVALGASLLVARDRGTEPASPPVLHLSGGVDGTVGGSEAGVAAGPNVAGGSAAGGSGPAVDPGALTGLRVDGDLPTGPGRAAVRTLPSGQPAEDDMAALAAALGVPGRPERTPEGWQVGPREPRLRVAAAPGLAWTLGTPVRPVPPPGVVACHAIVNGHRACVTGGPGVGVGQGSGDRIPERPDGVPGALPEGPSGGGAAGGDTGAGSASAGSGTSGSSSGSVLGQSTTGSLPGHSTTDGVESTARPPAPDTPTGAPAHRPPAESPTPAESVVRRAAGPVLDALGLSGARITVATWPGGGEVGADPMVDGLPTQGLSTRLVFDSGGRLVSATGWLGRPETGAEYPLATPARVLSGAMPRCDPCRATAVVTGARLGLLARWDSDARRGDRLVLVPAWRYDVLLPAGGRTQVFRIAVDPRYVAPPSVVEPPAAVEPAPAETGGPLPRVSAEPATPQAVPPAVSGGSGDAVGSALPPMEGDR